MCGISGRALRHLRVNDADEQTLIVGQLPPDHVFERSAIGPPDVFDITNDGFHTVILNKNTIRCQPGQPGPQPRDPRGRIFPSNLKNDPQETQNLAATHRKVLNDLAAALRAHIQRGGATPWQKPAGSPTDAL